MASNAVRSSLTLVPSPAKFNSAFIERRLRQHQKWQERENERLCEEVLDEAVQILNADRGFGPRRVLPFGKDCA